MPDHAILPAVLRQALDGDRPLETIPVPTDSVPRVELTNFITVGTYSYLDSEVPTLLIPAAPVVARVRLPAKINPDRDPSLIDGNAHKFPGCPLEPAIVTAALSSASTLDLSTLDFVLDRNCLRKLFGMIRGQDHAFRAFKIDGELVGNTVLFTRSEAEAWDLYKGYKGFSEEFRKSQTIPVRGLEDAAFHGASWRISKFDLGPFKILVRYECDAQTPVQVRSDSTTSVPDLSDLLAATNLSSASADTHPFPGSTKLAFRLTTVAVPPQSSLIALKTCRAGKPVDATRFWDQLFFSQTPHLWLAAHEQRQADRNGYFEAAMRKLELTKGELKEFGDTIGMDVVAKVVQMLAGMKEVVVREGKSGYGVSFVFEAGMDCLEAWRTKEGFRRRLVGKELRALFG